MSRFPLAKTAVGVAALTLALTGCQPKTVPPQVVAPPPPPSAVEHLVAGKRAVIAGDCKKAVPDLKKAARLAPRDVEARLYLGLCSAKSGDLAGARTVLTEAAGLDTTDPRPFEALGIAYYEAGRREDAATSLGEAVQRGSKSAQVHYYLGNLAMTRGDCRTGLAAYRQAIQLDPAYTAAATEYKHARMACARAETPPPVPVEPPKPKPKPKPAPATPAAGPSQAAAPAPSQAPQSGAKPQPAPAAPASAPGQTAAQTPAAPAP